MRPTIRLSSLAHALLTLTFLLMLPSACHGANDDPGTPPMTPPALAPCGMGDASISDFTLTDDNAMSPTFTQEISLSDYSGKVLLIFWMRAT